VTYDNAPEITSLYKSRRQFVFDINYSVETKRKGTEVMIVSKGLKVPAEIRERQTNRPQYRAA
jgi:DNA adenine methylase